MFSFIDLDHWLILDEITLPFAAAGIICSLFIPTHYFNPVNLLSIFLPVQFHIHANLPSWIHPGSLLLSFTSAIGGILVFWAIGTLGKFIAKREAMGGGDLKFALLMGAFLGPQKLALAIFIAVVACTVFMVPGILLGRKTERIGSICMLP